jgi:glutamyl-tRNA synthetase
MPKSPVFRAFCLKAAALRKMPAFTLFRIPAMASTVRTRFAPSPTGYLHIGGARTALFSWAYARRHGGTFVLRIEDTDVARSTPEAVQAIMDGMNWLDLNWDEGPFYQMQRMDRYKVVIQEMLAAGTAYPCYMPPEELDALREAQRARGEKPRYDGRWRPEAGKVLPEVPAGVLPAIRFRNPVDGVVAWNDLVKGRIEIANAEMDDLIIARPDGTPTYNFCVVVDDLDMGITQVIRGDDHVNNTPRQINILKALGGEVPQYAHLSMILGDDGQKLSKRHGAVSVTQYDDDGYLPEAVINYLARLGWSHGDNEIFSREQLVEWFDLDHITPSAAQFNTEKLNWLNAHYIKQADNARLAADVSRRLARREVDPEAGPVLEALIGLYKDRVSTLNELADAVEPFYIDLHPAADLLAQHLTEAARAALTSLRGKLAEVAWDKATLSATIKETCTAHGMKMPQVAIPLRVALLGQPQTPAIDAVLATMGRDLVLARLDRAL